MLFLILVLLATIFTKQLLAILGFYFIVSVSIHPIATVGQVFILLIKSAFILLQLVVQVLIFLVKSGFTLLPLVAKVIMVYCIFTLYCIDKQVSAVNTKNWYIPTTFCSNDRLRYLKQFLFVVVSLCFL